MKSMLRIALLMCAIVSGHVVASVSDYFVTSEYVSDNLNTLIILDARGYPAYLQGHLPGAINVQWQGLSLTEGKSGEKGWGNLLDDATLTAKLEALGIDQKKEIVVYADSPSGWGEEGRIAWSLREVGFNNVKILNGSYKLWKREGRAISIKPVVFPEKSRITQLKNNHELTIDTPELVNNYADFVVIDSRTPEEYKGATKFGEKRGGHLPGAVNVPFTEFMDDNGLLKPVADIEALLKKVGISKNTPVVVYCTAGIRSAHMVMVLKALGYESVRNYDSSFYRWAALPSTAVDQ